MGSRHRRERMGARSHAATSRANSAAFSSWGRSPQSYTRVSVAHEVDQQIEEPRWQDNLLAATQYRAGPGPPSGRQPPTGAPSVASAALLMAPQQQRPDARVARPQSIRSSPTTKSVSSSA
jgi:hypothetical protein